jgi:hypothetical protein
MLRPISRQDCIAFTIHHSRGAVKVPSFVVLPAHLDDALPHEWLRHLNSANHAFESRGCGSWHRYKRPACLEALGKISTTIRLLTLWPGPPPPPPSPPPASQSYNLEGHGSHTSCLALHNVGSRPQPPDRTSFQQKMIGKMAYYQSYYKPMTSCR